MLESHDSTIVFAIIWKPNLQNEKGIQNLKDKKISSFVIKKP